MPQTKRLLILEHTYNVGNAKNICLHLGFNGKIYTEEMRMPIIKRTLTRDGFIVNIYPPKKGMVLVKVYERLNT